MSVKIAEYVRKHPGCKSAEIWAALTENRRCYSSLAYAQNKELVFAAGPSTCMTYYPDRFSAMENNDRLIREHEAAVKANKKAKRARSKQKQKQQRRVKAAQTKPARSEPRPKLLSQPATSIDGLKLLPGCKFVRAEPFVDHRYAPDPGWQGQITADWHERRLKGE
jgi:hypothetical protein